MWKAEKALIEKEMKLANTIRVAMANQSQYSRFFNNLRTRLAALDGKASPVYDEAWAAIRAKGRG